VNTVRPKIPVTFGYVFRTVGVAVFLWIITFFTVAEYSEHGQIGNLPQGNISADAPIVIAIEASLASLFTYLSFVGARKFLRERHETKDKNRA
jgi:hypothetical protein